MIVTDPGVTPVTVTTLPEPLREPIEGLLVLHAPPDVASLSVNDAFTHALAKDGPLMVAGCALSVTGIVVYEPTP